MDKTQKKLNYCKETKNLIRQAIIDMGVDVPNDIPFEEYPDYIRGIGGSGVFTFSGLKRALTNGDAREKYPIGTEIPDKWIDTAENKTYDMPMIIVHYGDVKLTDGTVATGAYLMRKYVTPFGVQFDAPDSKHPSGYNRYSQSSMYKWLNSNADKGQWWYSSFDGDVVSETASIKDGYMKGCSAALLNAISEIKISTSTNTTTDDGVTDEVNCHFFLPSREELYCVPGVTNAAMAGVEGEAWDYFKVTSSPNDSACSIRVFKDSTNTIKPCLLRSAVRGYTHCVWAMYTDGSANSHYFANGIDACAPACVII